MNSADIARRRLHNQHIAAPALERPEEVVSRLGAVQAQDYPGAKWAVALRTAGVTDADFQRAFDEGRILRTHVLRPTWHFVAPADIRWMIALTAPRINAAASYRRRELGLTERVFERSNAAVAKALEGGRALTRDELIAVLQKARLGLEVRERFSHMLMRAEVDGLVCSGPLRGKQQTYMLLDERVPPAGGLEREAALAELAGRYFATRGPATLADFVWWSGLTTGDARAGLEQVEDRFEQAVVDGQTYWLPPAAPASGRAARAAYLLPDYDEYLVAYRDRSAVFDSAHGGKLGARGNVLGDYTIVLDGRIAGIWTRTPKKDAVLIETRPFAPLTKAQQRAVRAAAERYGDFLGVAVTLA